MSVQCKSEHSHRSWWVAFPHSYSPINHSAYFQRLCSVNLNTLIDPGESLSPIHTPQSITVLTFKILSVQCKSEHSHRSWWVAFPHSYSPINHSAYFQRLCSVNLNTLIDPGESLFPHSYSPINHSAYFQRLCSVNLNTLIDPGESLSPIHSYSQSITVLTFNRLCSVNLNTLIDPGESLPPFILPNQSQCLLSMSVQCKSEHSHRSWWVAFPIHTPQSITVLTFNVCAV